MHGQTQYPKRLIYNYGPSGLQWKKRLYQTGEPCSLCVSGTICSKEYHGLCVGKCKDLLLRSSDSLVSKLNFYIKFATLQIDLS